MLTPQEVSERAFPKASFGGYNMAQVDEFLDLLTADYTSLYNENAVLKSKMKVLVEKVEEYRATEDAMRKALMTAQRMADELVKEAEAKKAQILSDAEGEAKERVANIRKQAGDEEFRLSAAQSATAAYVAKVRALHEQELRYLDGLSQLCPDAPVSQADPVEEAVEEIDDNVQRLVAQAMADATAENLKAQAAQEAAEGPEDLSDTAEFPPAPQAEEEPEEEPKRYRKHRKSSSRRVEGFRSPGCKPRSIASGGVARWGASARRMLAESEPDRGAEPE